MESIKLKNIIYLTNDEIDELVKITSDKELMKYINIPYNKRKIMEFIKDEKDQNANRKYWTYAILLGTKIIGMYIIKKRELAKLLFISTKARKYLTTHLKNCGLYFSMVILIAGDHQGKGIGYKVIKMGEDLITKISQNSCIIAFVDKNNIPSIKLHEKLSYKVFIDKKYNIYYK